MTTSMASHIIGGDVSYQFLNYNEDSTLMTYSVEFIIYRDTAGLDFDFIADFGIFRQQEVDGPWETYEVISGIAIGSILRINALEDPCKDEILSQLIIESGTYNFDVTLEVGDFNYMVAYQRCCRNWTITNILDPGETGAVYDIIITPEAQRLGNESPIFKSYPPIFVCLGFDFDFDHGALDAEGDSLSYSFCTPFISGTNPGNPPAICCDCVKPDPATCLPGFDHVTFTGIYNEDNPVGGDPQIGIDPISGRISGVPNIMGSFVVGVCVEEFREGTLIGTYRRDFEFNVEVCTPRVLADLVSDSLINNTDGWTTRQVHRYTSCDPDIHIDNLSVDEAFIEDYKWLIYDSKDSLVVSRQGRLERDIDLLLPGAGIYRGNMVLNDLDKCVDTAFLQIHILPLVDLAFDYALDPCLPLPVDVHNTSSYASDEDLDWLWSLDGVDIGNGQDVVLNDLDIGPYQLTLEVIDALGCKAELSDSLDYNYYSTPLIEDQITQVICMGDSFLFEGSYIFEEGDYEHLYTTRLEGCDSLIRKLSLTYYPDPLVNIVDTIICNGTDILFDGVLRYASGIYERSVHYKDESCDSIIYMLDLEVSPYPILVDVDTLLCYDDSIRFENRWIKTPGTYQEIIKSTMTKCDSFEYTLTVDFTQTLKMSEMDTIICPGDSVLFERVWYDESGRYSSLLVSDGGCDSLLRFFNLEVRDPLAVEVICEDSIHPYLDYPLEVVVNRDDFSVLWTPADGLSCDDCADPIVNIAQDQLYLLEVEDDLGCYYAKEIRFFVDPLIDFYLPNVVMKQSPINPVNEFFFLHNSPDYSFQYNMVIYDRWGSEVGKKMNISTNVADDGWSPRDYLPGVYVYYIEVLADIEPRILVGDLTVIK